MSAKRAFLQGLYDRFHGHSAQQSAQWRVEFQHLDEDEQEAYLAGLKPEATVEEAKLYAKPKDVAHKKQSAANEARSPALGYVVVPADASAKVPFVIEPPKDDDLVEHPETAVRNPNIKYREVSPGRWEPYVPGEVDLT